jgi:hypothetical protein
VGLKRIFKAEGGGIFKILKAEKRESGRREGGKRKGGGWEGVEVGEGL